MKCKALLVAAVAASSLLLSGCFTDTSKASWSAFGQPHEITVYQRDNIIYHGFSTGKVSQNEHAIAFEDVKTREYVEISLGQSATVISKVVGLPQVK